MIGMYEKDHFRLVYGQLKCPNGTIFRMNPELKNNTEDDFLVSKDGWLSNELKTIKIPPGKFCLEQFSDSKYRISTNWCDEGKLPENLESDFSQFLIMIGVLLSLPFLLITFLVYALIRELRNLHGKSLMCHVASLLVAYTSLMINKTSTNKINGDGCLALGE